MNAKVEAQAMVEVFGTQEKAADFFNVRQSAVSNWIARGLPELRKLQLQARRPTLYRVFTGRCSERTV